MYNNSTNGYLAPEIEVIIINAEGVICASGDIPGLRDYPDGIFDF